MFVSVTDQYFLLSIKIYLKRHRLHDDKFEKQDHSLCQRKKRALEVESNSLLGITKDSPVHKRTFMCEIEQEKLMICNVFMQFNWLKHEKLVAANNFIKYTKRLDLIDVVKFIIKKT